MFKKVLMVSILAAAMSTAYAGGNNNGPKFGGGDSNANAAALGVGVGIGVGHAKAGAAAINSNKIGVRNDVDSHNFNRNLNDNHNFNRNLNNNTAKGGNAFQGQGQEQGQMQVTNIVESPYKLIQSQHEERSEHRIYNTPSVNAIAAPPSAPCYVGFGASGNLPGVGFGLSGSTYDKECEVRETVRLAQVDSDPNVRSLASQVLAYRLNEYIVEDHKEAPTARPTEQGIFALNDN